MAAEEKVLTFRFGVTSLWDKMMIDIPTRRSPVFLSHTTTTTETC